jgi:hypothetical protein
MVFWESVIGQACTWSVASPGRRLAPSVGALNVHLFGDPCQMSTPVSIVIGAALISVAIMVVFRWEVSGPGILRLDRWTGSIAVCDFDLHTSPTMANCEPK